jgi:hypothetical protein
MPENELNYFNKVYKIILQFIYKYISNSSIFVLFKLITYQIPIKMTNKEFYLIKHITTTGHKNPIQVVDKVQATTLTAAKAMFEQRNDFTRLFRKSDLEIAEIKQYLF